MFNQLKTTAVIALLTFSSPAIALDLDLDNMSGAEKDAFGQLVRDYILDNPDIIMDAFRILEQRQEVADLHADTTLIAENLQNIQHDGFSWEGGNPDGDITLVEFLDYKCGYCRKAHDEVASLVASDGNIRLIVKEYPILSQDSLNLSRAAVATLQSLGPDAYKKMHDLFISYNGPVTNDAISFLANKAGLDAPTIVAMMDEPSVDGQIGKIRQLGQALNVSGTPTFIFNDQIVRGYIPEDNMKQIVAELRAQTQ